MAAPYNNNIKDKILRETSRLLEKVPFTDISIADIAAASGLSKGSIYYYYNSKEELLYDIADSYLSKIYDDLLVWVSNREKDTSLPRLLHFVLKRGMDESGKGLRLHITMDAIAGNETIRAKLLEKYNAFHKVLAEKIRERKEEADGAYTAWLLITLIDGMLVQNLLQNDTMDIPDFIDKTVEMLLQNDAT